MANRETDGEWTSWGGGELAVPDAVDDKMTELVQAALKVVEEGDYFMVLGVERDASPHDIRRAFLAQRRTFEPTQMAGAKQTEDARLIVRVLEEAYQVLHDPPRRERYLKAISAI